MFGQSFDPESTATLQYPEDRAIADAYRSLPRRGELLLSCATEELARTLRGCEAAGFHGMRIHPAGLAMRSVEIQAFKGKQGPCFETGRSARYRGCAAAALDDDNHLLAGEMRVCEKTGAIYAREPYADLVAVDEADPELSARLDADPVPFDCDTLERDAAELRARLAAPDRGVRRPVLYTGPFRLLVLPDGTLLRRGEVAPVPAAIADELCAGEGCVAAGDADGVAPQFFHDAYDAEGAAFVLGEQPLAECFTADVERDLGALEQTSEEMLARLRHLVERGDPQFVLVGSDPRVQFGCCPNDEVYDANRLVEAGILALWRAPVPPDACPTTIYAFAGELASHGGRPRVRIDRELRREIAEALAARGKA